MSSHVSGILCPKRAIPFLCGCILFHSFLAFLAYSLPVKWLQFMGWLALVPAIGFLFIWLTGSRKSGPETLGAPIWWNNLRPVHALFYLTFAYLAIHGIKEHAWKVLALDVSLGFLSWIIAIFYKY
jgi:hypothetical protein